MNAIEALKAAKEKPGVVFARPKHWDAGCYHNGKRILAPDAFYWSTEFEGFMSFDPDADGLLSCENCIDDDWELVTLAQLKAEARA